MKKRLACHIQAIPRQASVQGLSRLTCPNTDKLSAHFCGKSDRLTNKPSTLFIDMSQVLDDYSSAQERIYGLWCLYQETGRLEGINLYHVIDKNDFLNSTDSTQQSALSMAFYLNIKPIIDVIVDSRSVLLYEQDRSYSCPIFWVLHQNNMDLLGRMLRREPDLLFHQFESPDRNVQKGNNENVDRYHSVWHYAAKLGSLNAVTYLIKHYYQNPSFHMTNRDTFWKQFAKYSISSTHIGIVIKALLKGNRLI